MSKTNSYSAVEIQLGGDVATSGTFTVNYPAGKTAADFKSAEGHYFLALGATYRQPKDFTLSFGASAVTVTYLGATTLPANTKIYFQLEEVGEAKQAKGAVGVARTPVDIPGLRKLSLVQIDLGAPATADADGISASQALLASGSPSALLNGAVGAVLDVPRNVVAAWTGTAVLTVTGKDQYGQTVVERSASGTSLTGKKAFKSITSITTSADVTGLTVGTGTVLGLPVYLPTAGYVHAELQDGATVGSAGTFAAGLAANTASTATTADVRGTYAPNAAPDGSKAFSLVATLPDLDFLGNNQYAG